MQNMSNDYTFRWTNNHIITRFINNPTKITTAAITLPQTLTNLIITTSIKVKLFLPSQTPSSFITLVASEIGSKLTTIVQKEATSSVEEEHQ